MEIGGAVVRLGLAELRALAPVTLSVLTECAGNPQGYGANGVQQIEVSV